ncbi:MAG: RelA/SpoT domain-containing protein [Spirosomataceae bacterium]
MTLEQLNREHELIEFYHKLHPKLKDWGRFIDNRIVKLLQKKSSHFNFYSVQILPKYRLKSDDSIIKKVFYRDLEYSDDILKRLNDKIGTRIVVTSEIYVKQIEEIIIRETKYWKAKVSRSLSKSIDKDPKTFDYRALHINLTPTNKSSLFKGFSEEDLEYYVCELQIRTLLQQAYAEVAHDTVYKGVYSNNSKLVRILSKSEALMEVTDEFFCNATNEMKTGDEFENSLLESLKRWSSDELNFKFTEEIDPILTSDIFHIYNAERFDIYDITRELTTHKSDITSMLQRAKSYMIKQPVVLFIAFLLFTRRAELKQKWQFEQSILRDIFLMLGQSFGK